jgi:hypothetical protein
MPTKQQSSDTVKWTISVPRDTDQRLRAHLAEVGARKGDLSTFVAETVRWRLVRLNIEAAQAHNKDVDPDYLEQLIEDALTEVRAERFGKLA